MSWIFSCWASILILFPLSGPIISFWNTTLQLWPSCKSLLEVRLQLHRPGRSERLIKYFAPGVVLLFTCLLNIRNTLDCLQNQLSRSFIHSTCTILVRRLKKTRCIIIVNLIWYYRMIGGHQCYGDSYISGMESLPRKCLQMDLTWRLERGMLHFLTFRILYIHHSHELVFRLQINYN